MLMQTWRFSGDLPSSSLLQPRTHHRAAADAPLFVRRKASDSTSFICSSSSTFACLRVGINEIGEIAHNKVLIAATVSAAIGQLSKPFTSAIFYRSTFDLRTAFQPGGFPSSHSSTAVATATTLGFERGFSDAIFGLAVVYAGITMYDAQGVRREVGTHAKTLNKVLLKNQLNSIPSSDADSLIVSSPGKIYSDSESHDPLFLEGSSSFRRKPTNVSLSLRSDNKNGQSTPMLTSSLPADVEGKLENFTNTSAPLKESVGHTEIEVIAGALLGFIISLVVKAI